MLRCLQEGFRAGYWQVGCFVSWEKTLTASLSSLLLASLALFLSGCSVGAKPAPVAQVRPFAFWPAPPNEPRVQFLTTYNSSADIAPPEKGLSRMLYGEQSAAAYVINKPYGVRYANGCIYVCDVRSKGITVLDLRKRQTRVMGATGASSINKANDIAITPDGMKYVLDGGQSAILVYDLSERFVRAFRLIDASAVGIAAHGDLLYVADFKKGFVRVLDRNTGSELHTIGERGGEDGQFVGPLGITTDRDGNIYVSDTIKCRVQKFSPDGKLLLAFGTTGNRPGNFVRPKQLAVDSEGGIHVVDAAFGNVQVFDAAGQVVGYYGAPGRHPGAMDLPAGIDIMERDVELFAEFVHPAFQAQRLIFVANQFGVQKLSVYAMGQLKPGKTPNDVAANLAATSAGMAPATAPAAAEPGR